jgi:Flp pilus assembly pilin Flp
MLLTARRIRRSTIDLWHQANGAVALEYGLIAALIAVAILGALGEVRDALVGLPLQSVIDALMSVLS